MKIDIDLIKVDEASRIRQDTGNLSKLQESIGTVGLINPILVDERTGSLPGIVVCARVKILNGRKSKFTLSNSKMTS